MRVAGAPISWGVCEVPGWGWQYDASTVLAQMAEVGLAATEFGPDGFLPDDPQAKARRSLASHGLKAVGQFVPVVPARPGPRPPPRGRAGDGGPRRGAAPRPSCSPRRPGRRATTTVPCSTTPAGRRCWATSTGSPRLPPPAASPPRCTRTSAPWSSAARRPTGCSPAAASGCASTPATCSSAAATPSPSPGAPRADRPHPPQGRPPRLGPAGPVRREHLHRGRGRWDVRPPRGGRRRHRRHRRRAGGRRVCRVVRARAGHHPHGRPQPGEAGADGSLAPVESVRTSLHYLLGVAAQRSGVGV